MAASSRPFLELIERDAAAANIAIRALHHGHDSASLGHLVVDRVDGGTHRQPPLRVGRRVRVFAAVIQHALGENVESMDAKTHGTPGECGSPMSN